MQYYHVSRDYLGPSFTLEPRFPETAGPEEAGLPARVCFAPSIEHCLASISGTNNKAQVIGETIGRRKRLKGEWHHYNPSVYVTPKRLRRPPQDRSDFARTGERWALNNIPVEHAGFVCLAHLTRTGRVRLVKAPATLAVRMRENYRGLEGVFFPQ